MDRKPPVALFATDTELSYRALELLSGRGDVVVFSFGPLPPRFGAVRVVQPGDIAALMALFRGEGISELALAGKIEPALLFSGSLHPSGRAFLSSQGPWRGESLLAGIAALLQQAGVSLVPLTALFKEDLADPGVLSRRRPDDAETADVQAGAAAARALMAFRVGQAVAVRRGMVLAVEGIEGTDRMIERTGWYVKTGFSVVKIAGEGKDVRFDLPTVGTGTVAAMTAAAARLLAVEAGKTIIVNKRAVVEECDRHDIALVGI